MEFKKLSDVEVVAEPAESANVLIEENGVIKKTPKTAVGGASGFGEHWVLLSGKNWSVTASEGIYDAIKEYVDNGGTPITISTYYDEYDEYGRMRRYTHSLDADVIWSYEDNGDIVEFQIYGCNGILFYIKKDGNHSYYWD